MSYAFTHLIIAWVLAKIFQFLSKKKLTHLQWGLFLFGAILPDIDIALNWIFGGVIHRTFTHSLLFLVIIFVIVFLIAKLFAKSNKFSRNIALAIGAGILIHLIIDMFFFPGIMLLWPSHLYIEYFNAAYFSFEYLVSLSSTSQAYLSRINSMVFDMGLGVAWLMYLWVRKKIKF